MDRKFYTIEWLMDLSENEFRMQVLIPLFRIVGFKDVSDYHGGTQELGKDIVMWRKSLLSNREDYAVVVKAKKITGKARTDIAEISTQVVQALGSDYREKTTGDRRKIKRVILANSFPLSKEATESFYSALPISNADNVETLDGPRVVELLSEYQSIIGILPVVRTGLKKIKEEYKLREIAITTNERQELIEIVPSDSIPKEQLKAKIVFSHEGMERVQYFFRTGRRTRIPVEFIKQFKLPELFNNYFPGIKKFDTLEIGPFAAANKDIELVIHSGHGDVFFEELRLFIESAGTEELVLSNRNDYIGVKFIINVTHLDKCKMKCTVHMNNDSLNVHELYKYENILFKLRNAYSGESYHPFRGKVST